MCGSVSLIPLHTGSMVISTEEWGDRAAFVFTPEIFERGKAVNETYMGWFLIKRMLPDLLFLSGSIWLWFNTRNPAAFCFMLGTCINMYVHLQVWDIPNRVRKWFHGW